MINYDIRQNKSKGFSIVRSKDNSIFLSNIPTFQEASIMRTACEELKADPSEGAKKFLEALTSLEESKRPWLFGTMC